VSKLPKVERLKVRGDEVAGYSFMEKQSHIGRKNLRIVNSSPTLNEKIIEREK
jgi:hypothetical protein